MALPRLAAAALCILIAVRFSVPSMICQSRRRPLHCLAWILWITAGMAAIQAGGGTTLRFTGMQTSLMAANSLTVAFWEELAFRGLIFLPLTARLRPWRAGVLSSLLFAVYHYPVYGPETWPYQFLWGAACCAVLQRGVTIPYLMGAHFLTDCLSPVLLGIHPGLGLTYAGYGMMALAAALPWFGAPTASERSESVPRKCVQL